MTKNFFKKANKKSLSKTVEIIWFQAEFYSHCCEQDLYQVFTVFRFHISIAKPLLDKFLR